MQMTLVYMDSSEDGRGGYSLVKAFLHSAKARLWVTQQKDPFGRTNLMWSGTSDRSLYYGVYCLSLIDVDDAPLTEEEVRNYEDQMITEALATLTVEQRAAIERRLGTTPSS